MTTPPPGYQPYPPHGPYGPPPPKKGLSTGAVIAITFGSILGGVILIGALDATGDDTKPSDKATTRTSSPTPPTPATTTKTPKKTATPTGYPDGDYIIGEDIPAGTYQSSGAEPGAFELCLVSTKPTSKSVRPKYKSGNRDERIIITITAADGLLNISGCEPLTRRK